MEADEKEALKKNIEKFNAIDPKNRSLNRVCE